MNLHKALQIILILEVGIRKALADALKSGLMDPDGQPMFSAICPNALHPDFIYNTEDGDITVAVCHEGLHETGLVDPDDGTALTTPVWGYRDSLDGTCTWPGRTFEEWSGNPLEVTWINEITDAGLLTGRVGTDFDYSRLSVIDTSLHWAYSLHNCIVRGKEKDCGGETTLKNEGLPIVAHLHGGFTNADFDGNPEYFFSPDGPGNSGNVLGPRYVTNQYTYGNEQPAGTLWYHDHALGITRLNVYAGMAGFYILRDDKDTGEPDNSYNLPAYPYEVALAIQDRMFKDNGELFYPAFPGDPFYEGFILDEGADLSSFKNGGPTALAEFFGDFMVVNGKIWPKLDVEPRKYRLRLINGCDSRFLVLRFCDAGLKTDTGPMECEPEALIPFRIVGSDQGLGYTPGTSQTWDTLIFEPGGRYDVIFDFAGATDHRVIMTNAGCDEPFGGDFGNCADPFNMTDRIMAFDVVEPFNDLIPDKGIKNINIRPDNDKATRTRKVALFEGTDEYGRLQPLLGTAEPATDEDDNPIYWPEEDVYIDAGLAYGMDESRQQMSGTIAWHSPITEKICLGDKEEWEIWNVSADAHPVHLHLVNFEIVSRRPIKWDSNTDADGFLGDIGPTGDGTYLVKQPVVQHNGELGSGLRIENPTLGDENLNPGGYFEDAPKDMVTALPGQVTTIQARFDKPGRYVWHCHILSHEDHEMMRPFEVVTC